MSEWDGESAEGVPLLIEGSSPDKLPATNELAVILDLPAPLSVNRTRRIDRRSMPAQREWKRKADALFLLQKRRLLSKRSTDRSRRQ
jgi:hypothetical protein